MSREYWVYDLETLANLFVGVFSSYKDDARKVFVVHSLKNDLPELINFLHQCKKQGAWFFGFNNLAFDAQIIQRIMDQSDRYIAMSPDEFTASIYQYSQDVIERSNRGEWQDYPEWKLSIPQVDIFKLNHWDNEAKRTSLKWVQYGIDWHNVEEMPYPHYKPVTSIDTLSKIVSYCINDVESTKAVFLDDTMKRQINIRSKLSKEYKLRLHSASEPRISKEIFIYFLCKKLGATPKMIKELRTVRTEVPVAPLILPYVKFYLPEFNMALNWFKHLSVTITDGKIKGPQHLMVHKGVETVYALGGIHGCIKSGVYTSNKDWIIMTADVTSFYPNLAIRNRWSPAHLPNEVFCDLYEWFFEERKKYDKSDPLNYLYKIILNSTYGLSKSKHSFLYDPELTFRITVNGQLLLSMLYERISLGIPESVPLMQNTDGLEFLIPRDKVDVYHKICKEWEEMTQLQLEIDVYKSMIIRDVNNYIAINQKDKVKCKGAFEWKDIPLHKNKSFLVIPKALYEYFVNGVKPEDYLETNKNIFDYCAGVKIKGEWYFMADYIKGGVHHRDKLQKIIRYYVSTSGVKLSKCHPDGRQIQVEAGKWVQTVFNKYVDKPFEDYQIDKRYYLEQIYQEITNIEGTKKELTQLSLF